MKLTLRTLLAYWDGVLEPQSMAAMREKVQHGRMAQGLIRRIERLLVQPPRLPPAEDLQAFPDDANSIAEYLDNTLPNARVAEFEQSCLTEDARLAEVAACHQLLSSALSKATPVPASLREQICSLSAGEGLLLRSAIIDGASLPAESHPGIPSTTRPRVEAIPESVGHPSPVPPVRQEPVRSIPAAGIELDDDLGKHVPEYLRTGGGRDWATPLSLVGLLVAMLLVGWWSLGPWESLRAILAPTAGPAIVQERPARKESAVPSSPAIDSTQPPDTSQPVPMARAPSDDEGTRSSPSTNPVEKEAAKPATEEAAPVPPQALPSPTEAGSNDLDRSTATTITTSPPSPMAGTPARADEPSPATFPAPPATVAASPVHEASVPTPPKALPPPSDIASLPATNPAGAVTTLSEVQWLPETRDGKNGVLLAWRELEDRESLQRLATGAFLAPGDQLVIPAGYRTELRLGSGIRWTVADESWCERIPESDGWVGLGLFLGRALVEPTPEAKRLRLQTPRGEIKVAFDTPNSRVAIELTYHRLPGKRLDAEAAEGTWAEPRLTLWGVQGKSRVLMEGAQVMDLEVAQTLTWDGEWEVQPGQIATPQEIPWWFREATPRPIDRQAAAEFFKIMTASPPEQAAADALGDALADRRPEVAALALRCAFLCGDFTRLLGPRGLLAKTAIRLYRRSILDSLVQVLAARPQAREQFLRMLRATEPDRADRLVALFSLPANDDLAAGADQRLVEALGSSFLDERALAIEQLRTITGKDYGYQEDRRSNESQQIWRRLQAEGKIRWPE